MAKCNTFVREKPNLASKEIQKLKFEHVSLEKNMKKIIDEKQKLGFESKRNQKSSLC